MKKKYETTYCPFCSKEYQAEVWGNVSVFPLTKSHDCEEQKKVEEAKRKFYGGKV